MANNRAYIRFVRTGHEVFFAKYYPSTGWYVPKPEQFLAEITRAFEGEPHGETMYGLGEIQLAYEQIEHDDDQEATATMETLVYRTPDGLLGSPSEG